MDAETPTHMPHVAARVPRPVVKAIDTLSEQLGMSRSRVVCDLLIAALSERGLWPPPMPDGRP